MKYLHLDPLFTPYGTSMDYESFVFHGGEPHIKINETDIGGEVMITHRIRSFNDLGLLLIATDALRRNGVSVIRVLLPYFPGARQDRIMTQGEPLSVKVYTDLINAQDYDEVIVFDPHSEVTPALLDRVTVIDNYGFVRKCLDQLNENVVLIAPDGGALKKIYRLSEYLGGIEVIECSKKRNVKTGDLSGFSVYHEDLKGKYGVIVDDICDGGGTFLGLAKALKQKNIQKLSLIVSHGIFSKGFTDLKEQFDMIFTTDSFKTITESDIVQLPVVSL